MHKQITDMLSVRSYQIIHNRLCFVPLTPFSFNREKSSSNYQQLKNCYQSDELSLCRVSEGCASALRFVARGTLARTPSIQHKWSRLVKEDFKTLRFFIHYFDQKTKSRSKLVYLSKLGFIREERREVFCRTQKPNN